MERVLPGRYVVVGVVALALVAAAGWLLRWWVVVPWYDEFVHLFTGVVFVTPLVAALAGPELSRRLAPWRAVVLGTLAWSGLGAGWELVEWSLDELFGINTLKQYGDTLSDLALNGGGAFVGMLLSVRPTSQRRRRLPV